MLVRYDVDHYFWRFMRQWSGAQGKRWEMISLLSVVIVNTIFIRQGASLIGIGWVMK